MGLQSLCFDYSNLIVNDSANEKPGLLHVTTMEVDEQYGILPAFRQHYSAYFFPLPCPIRRPLHAHGSRVWKSRGSSPPRVLLGMGRKVSTYRVNSLLHIDVHDDPQ